MLHAFLILLSLLTDHEVMADLARCAFVASFANVGLVGLIGACLVMRRRLVHSQQAR